MPYRTRCWTRTGSMPPGPTAGGGRATTSPSSTRCTGSINVIWGPELPTLVASEFDTFTDFGASPQAAGLAYEQERPFGPWQIRFDGRLNDGGDDVECRAEALGSASGNAAAVPVRYQLTFTPSHPPYIYRERAEWSELFTGHVDEVGRVRGTLTVGDRSYPIRRRRRQGSFLGRPELVRPARLAVGGPGVGDRAAADAMAGQLRAGAVAGRWRALRRRRPAAAGELHRGPPGDSRRGPSRGQHSPGETAARRAAR